MELLATVISIVVGLATIGSLLFAASKWVIVYPLYRVIGVNSTLNAFNP